MKTYRLFLDGRDLGLVNSRPEPVEILDEYHCTEERECHYTRIARHFATQMNFEATGVVTVMHYRTEQSHPLVETRQ